jgi:hypothetical protein
MQKILLKDNSYQIDNFWLLSGDFTKSDPKVADQKQRGSIRGSWEDKISRINRIELYLVDFFLSALRIFYLTVIQN